MANIISQIKTKYCLAILTILLLVVFFPAASRAASSDAVAVRILPNPEHYSALRWYKEKGFKGSPQSLTVDGYEAVRDGRTVYVDAGNADDMGNLYTNIYLISYNQAAEQKTTDIFAQILSHWKFNTNLNTAGSCNLTASQSCLIDSECPLKEYCNSDKANIIRDTKRQADFADLASFLEDYKKKNGHYPIVGSGSYLQYATISVWPSWQKTLAQNLSASLPVDPINQLGPCRVPNDSRFNPITCWDEGGHEFAGTYVAPTNPGDLPELELPADSFAYKYRASPNGLSYFLDMDVEYGTSSVSRGNDNTTIGGNHAPRFLTTKLQGYSGREFVGYVRAIDPDGDPLTWSIDLSLVNWTGAQWSAAPTVTVVSSGYYRLHADKAGVAGNYEFYFYVNDGQGESNSTTSKHFIINVKNPAPVLAASVPTYTVSSTNPFIVTMTARDDVFTYPLRFEFSDTKLNDYGLLSYQGQPQPTFLLDSNNVFYTFRLQGIFAPNPPNGSDPQSRVWQVNTSKAFQFHVNIIDDYGAESGKDLTINLRNNKPVINAPIHCDDHVRRGYSYPAGYSYPTCVTAAYDPDGNAIIYHDYPAGLPSNLTYVQSTGLVSGTVGWTLGCGSAVSCPHTVTANVTDEYGAVSNPTTFRIQVNSYCGDGQKQTNAEGRGGPSGYGVEDCDAAIGSGSPYTSGYTTLSGVAQNAQSSSQTNQYSCNTYNIGSGNVNACPLDTSSNPSRCFNTCTYTGGWCGDGTAQNSINGVTNRPNFYPEQCDTRNNSQSCWVTADPYNTQRRCVFTYCGDRVKQSPNGYQELEICDRGPSNGLATSPCNSNCEPAHCGDGSQQWTDVATDQVIQQIYEQCDDGANNNNNGRCTLKCQLARCGDGFQQPLFDLGLGPRNEQCDLGDGRNGAPSSDCDINCQVSCHPCVFDDSISVFGTGVFTTPMLPNFGCCFQ